MTGKYGRGAQVEVVDAQVHIWGAGKPSPHHRQEPYSADELLRDMDAAGVDRAVLVPPTWDPEGNELSLRAARDHPDRFAVMGLIDLDRRLSTSELHQWAAQPGMLGARLSFNRPDTRARLIDGSIDWFWRAAEQAGVPLMLLIPGLLPWVAMLAERHPGLRIIVDHLAVPRGAKGAEAFEHLPELIALARFPNIAVKAAGIPGYAQNEAYPYRSLHQYLEPVFDAFGAGRVFWGTDLSRMPVPYRDCVTMFSEALDFLSDEERDQTMGLGLRQWLGWTPPSISTARQATVHAS